MSSTFPRQAIPQNQKNKEWYKSNVDYFIQQSDYYSDDRWEMILLYKAAIGELDKSAYSYVLNPYNSQEENLKQYPAQLRNYDFITPIINLYLGEKAEKVNNHEVIVTNEDAINIHKEKLNKAFLSYLSQSFINELNSSGVETGVSSKELPSPEEYLSKFKVGNTDIRAIQGQEAIDYIKYALDTKDKMQEAFFDWLAVGRVYTFKDVYKNDLIYEIVPPLEAWHGTTNTGFVEDSNWFVRRTRYNLNQVIDKFSEDLDDDEIKNLEQGLINGDGFNTSNFIQTTNLDKNFSSDTTNNLLTLNNNLIDVFHVTWKSLRNIKILKYTSQETLEVLEMEVDDSYILNRDNGDISLTKETINEVHECYKIGNNLYKKGRPLLAQRDELANSSICKLPYNGRVGYTERNKINSIVKSLLNYQALYNIYHYRAELTLARNKDKIMLMPLGLLPEGWTEDKFLYFAETTGLAFFDETKPNAAAVLNAIRSIDMNLGNYVAQMRDLLISIKNEAWDSVGMNRQRFGNISASDGKGITEQAQLRSSVISREMFRRFERLEESDLQGLLDYSKLAWINGKKGMYISSDDTKAMLNINPEIHCNSDYGVFVKDSNAEGEKLQQAKQFAFGWAQKSNVPASNVLEILDSNNMSKLKNFIKIQEDIQQQLLEKQQEADRQNSQVLADKEAQIAAQDNQTKIQVAQIQAGSLIESANIKAATDLTNLSNSENIDNTDLKIQEQYNKYQENLRKSQLEKDKLGAKINNDIAYKRVEEAKLQLKKEEIKSKERIAKTNKNRYDK
jgi:hypothetical protein